MLQNTGKICRAGTARVAAARIGPLAMEISIDQVIAAARHPGTAP
jgi:hypothetical protein